MNFSQLLSEASVAEQQAMSADRDGKVAYAQESYQICIDKLKQALSLCPLQHPDAEVIQQHITEIHNRIVYLSTLSYSSRPLIPLESHISPVQLSVAPAAPISTSKTMGAAAAIGGVGGLLLLGPLGLVAGAAGAAYATTRDDRLGSATRGVAQSSVVMANKAGEIDREHHITAKAREMGSAAISKASEFDQRYEVTEKVKAAGAETARALSDFNQKYKVTETVSSGVSSGIAKLSSFFAPSSNREGM